MLNIITVNLVFAGSRYLADEIAQGAPADVFASANRRLMAPVMRAGRMSNDSGRVFARNRLAVVAQKNNPAQLATLRDLVRPGLKIALGTRSTGIGAYALDVLTKAEQLGRIGVPDREAALQNVAFYERDVRAVLSKVMVGDADAAFVYTSDCHDAADEAAASIIYPLEELWFNTG